MSGIKIERPTVVAVSVRNGQVTYDVHSYTMVYRRNQVLTAEENAVKMDGFVTEFDRLATILETSDERGHIMGKFVKNGLFTSRPALDADTDVSSF